MEFDLSEDQLALRDAATDLLAQMSSPDKVRVIVDGGGGWDRSLWTALVEQGWPSLLIPESAGGVGLGWVEAALVLEAVGAHVAPVPILAQLVAADLLSEAGSPVMDQVSSGERIAVAVSTVMAADSTDGGWKLSGQSEPVAFAPSADILLIVGSDGRQESLFALDASSLHPPPLPAMDNTRELARLDLDGHPAERLGGPDAAQRFRDLMALALSAEMLGCASRALEMAVAYATEREQFGRPIGSFQAIKHRCADMLVDVEGMRSATWWAAWCASNSAEELPEAASTAKAWCSDAADRVLTSALQVYGGLGFTWECDLHLYLKRVQQDRVSFGSAADHRDRLADILRARVRDGASVI